MKNDRIETFTKNFEKSLTQSIQKMIKDVVRDVVTLELKKRGVTGSAAKTALRNATR